MPMQAMAKIPDFFIEWCTDDFSIRDRSNFPGTPFTACFVMWISIILFCWKSIRILVTTGVGLI